MDSCQKGGGGDGMKDGEEMNVYAQPVDSDNNMGIGLGRGQGGAG